ncbi:MAG: BamA/TamA family outer membrane protein [Mangrovibacterium sp.]
MKKIFLFLIAFASIYKPFAQTNNGSGQVSFSLFMIGNCGKFKNSDPEHQLLLETLINFNNNKKGVIFLGNNLYPSLSDVFSENLENKQAHPHLDQLRQFNGPICFVPGWTDWSFGTPNGKDMIKWEYKTIHTHLKDKELYMPDWGCPGPMEVPVSDSLTIILLDTQWWLHPFDTRFGKCDLEDESGFWISLRDLLRLNRNKQVVVAGYHPIVSYGEFGGYFPLAKQLLAFPVAVYRKTLGTRLDMAHPEYAAFRENLSAVLAEFPNVIYASSHERNFQYFNENNIHYIIGGSLVGGRYLKKKETVCSSKSPGLVRLDFCADGQVKLQFLPLDRLNGPECQTTLYTYLHEQIEEKTQTFAETLPDSMLKEASRQYQTPERSWKWMGKNYRDVWAEPVNVPVFDIGKEHGGLKIVKRGGGQQTQSLRLESTNGQQYTLRSMEKFVEGALPDEVRNTLAVDVVQDNISASNPYASLVVAQLADAAGVMHTNPKIVYVPRDPRLGEYIEDLAGKLFLYEERPDGDWANQKSFGYSSHIVGTDDVLEEIEDSPEHRVDQLAVLEARLFDTFINDWDRHDDQWRWASFKENGKTIYRPIPRDRDQAFYVNEGILPWLVSRKWLMPKIQGFAPITENMDGLTFNARYFDRTFLTEPDWRDWKNMVDSLKTRLTEEDIRTAVLAFPKEVQPYCAEQTVDILLKRKENLEEMARQHYLSLAKNVDIIGTNEDDIFNIKQKENSETEISLYSSNDKPPYYQRTFSAEETREIRFYGLDGKDVFEFEGNAGNKIKIRVIGGKGKDFFLNQSTAKYGGKNIHVYDTKSGVVIQSDSNLKSHFSANKTTTDYDRMDFHHNVVTPGIFMGYNQDDGVFVGGGPVFNNFKFRRHDTHTLKANLASRTTAFNAFYNYQSMSQAGGFDHHATIELKAPDYAMNYFGMGNKTIKDDALGDQHYRLRINQLHMNYSIGRRWGRTAFQASDKGQINEHELRAGTFMNHSDVEAYHGRFIADLEHNGLQPEDLQGQWHTGFSLQYAYTNLDRETNPRRGYRFSTGASQYVQLNGEHEPFSKINADLRAYLSFTKEPRTVLAIRFGGEKLFGNYYFAEAARLGGKTNLRGYLADRFYGDGAIWQNTELRFKLFNFSSYLLNGELGLLGFHDSGRVWLSGEHSSRWHKGYGAGFWLSPFGMTIFTATYNWSREDQMVQATLNFKF